MLADFYYKLKQADLPVSITEYLTLLEALEARIAAISVDDFYYLSALIKDERHDRFDQVFGAYYKGMEELFDTVVGEIPEEWLRKPELMLTEEEKQQIEAMGGFEKLMETLKQRLEAKKRHQGGNKWNAAGNRSEPMGTTLKVCASVRRRAVTGARSKSGTSANTRTWTIRSSPVHATSRWRCASCGILPAKAPLTSLDLDDTIRSTARNGGLLDIKMVPERHNAVKVLLLSDIGGSMDDHIRACEELFSAARTEFKHSSITTSTTACMNTCGKTIAADTPSVSPPGTSFGSTARTTNACLYPTPP